MSFGEVPFKIVAISAGTGEASTTRMLIDRAAQAVIAKLRESGRNTDVRVIELAPIAAAIAKSLVSGFPEKEVQAAIDEIAGADGILVSTPVYKAGMSGLFKSFIDILDNDLLVAKPVLLAASAGSARHAMIVDDHLRPLFSFMRAIPVPTGLFAAPEDWGDGELTRRVSRAAGEFAALVDAKITSRIVDTGWGDYQHSFGGNASRAERSADDVNFDTDLMRLATGGSLQPREK